MSYFPMMVNLEGARVLVIGGGEEGRKRCCMFSLQWRKEPICCTVREISDQEKPSLRDRRDK